MGNRTVIVMGYSISKMMDLEKIKKFKADLEEFQKSGRDLKIVLYGDYTNDELSASMTYFNRFTNSQICDYAISFKTKDIVVESGLGDRKFGRITTNVTENSIQDQVKKLYDDEDVDVMIKSNTHWEDMLVDLMNK